MTRPLDASKQVLRAATHGLMLRHDVSPLGVSLAAVPRATPRPADLHVPIRAATTPAVAAFRARRLRRRGLLSSTRKGVLFRAAMNAHEVQPTPREIREPHIARFRHPKANACRKSWLG